MAKSYVRLHFGHLCESQSASGVCQLIGQAANLM